MISNQLILSNLTQQWYFRHYAAETFGPQCLFRMVSSEFCLNVS